MVFGVFNIDKPLHCTSHDVVAKLRKKLNVKRVGHAGTLDPLASGVLPVCVGQATRLIEYFPGDKRYTARILFGATTPTWDAEGEWCNPVSAKALTAEIIEDFLTEMHGTLQQQVPPHSAVHVHGKKLYEYARQGIVVALPVRPTQIYSATLQGFENAGEDHPVAVVDIHCSSGTYIRSIAQELGVKTGFGAHLAGLVRTAHGQFLLAESVALQDLLDADQPVERWLQAPRDYLALPAITVTTLQANRLRHGMKLDVQELTVTVKQHQRYQLFEAAELIAIALCEETGRLKPIKVFSPTPINPLMPAI